jgi:hypothetical protein
LEQCMLQAHLGINVDLPCYETKIGARNRLIEFMARGVPILTTLGTEISQILFFKGLAFTVPIQQPAALANEIILYANHPDKLERMAHDARNYFEAQYTYDVTVKDLKEWCNNPCHSRDYGHPLLLDYRNPFVQQPRSGGLRSRLRRLFQNP